MRTAQPDKRTRLIETATKLGVWTRFPRDESGGHREAARVPVAMSTTTSKPRKTRRSRGWSGASRVSRSPGGVGRLSSPKERCCFCDTIHGTGSNLRAEDALLAGCARSCKKEGGALAKKSAALFQ